MQRTHTPWIVLGALVVLPIAASAARGDHLRHAEERANDAHARAVEYVRYLQRHVPPSGASPMLLEDASAIFRSVCELQQSLLFASGQPGELEELRRYARGLHRYIRETRQRLNQLESELEHGGGHLAHAAHPGVAPYAGPSTRRVDSLPGVEILPSPEVVPKYHIRDLPRHDRHDRERLRSRVGLLEDRLKEVEHAIERILDHL